MDGIENKGISHTRPTLVSLVILIVFNFIACTNPDPQASGNNDSLGKGNHSGSRKQAESQKKDSALIYNPVNGIYESFAIDEKPIFPGGDKGLTKYLEKHTVYPTQAKQQGIEGTVFVRFVVTKTGKIGETDIMRAVDPLLEMEAIRVVKSLPKWIPGKKGGKEVDVWLIVPVGFRL